MSRQMIDGAGERDGHRQEDQRLRDGLAAPEPIGERGEEQADLTANSGTRMIQPAVLRIARSMSGSVKTNRKLSRPTKLLGARVLEADQDGVDHRDRRGTPRGSPGTGPTKTYGRTPSADRVGSRSTTRFIAQYRKNTPPTPTTIATPTTMKRFASLVAQVVEVRPQERRTRRSGWPARRPAAGRDSEHRFAPRVGGSAPRSAPASAGAIRGRLHADILPPVEPTRKPEGAAASGRSLRVDHASSIDARSLLTRASCLDLVQHVLSSESGPSCMYSTIPVQKLPAPTAAGIRSEASKPARAVRDRLGQHGRRVGQDLVRVAVRPDVDVRRDPRRGRIARPARTGRPRPRTARGSPSTSGRLPSVPTTASSPANRVPSWSIGGKREPVVVHARLRALREEGVDEARLPVQPAARRVLEHRQRRVAEGDRRRVCSAPPRT